jgi:hypothetical protein
VSPVASDRSSEQLPDSSVLLADESSVVSEWLPDDDEPDPVESESETVTGGRTHRSICSASVEA